MIEMTREAMPPGEYRAYFGERCACGGSEFTFSANVPVRLTRSVKPLPDGSWLVQCHEEWCPQWTGRVPELPCPTCGAPVETVSVDYQIYYRVSSAPGLVVEGTEENERRYGWEWRPDHSEVSAVSLDPCGHQLRRHYDDVDAFLAAAGQVQARRAQAEADAILHHHADLIDAARAAGATGLVVAYEDAVRSGSSTALGLREALRVQADVPCRCDATVEVAGFGGNVVRRISQCMRHRPDPTPAQLLAAAHRMADERNAALIGESGSSGSDA